MGHRHMFNASQTFDTDNNQNWNHVHAEQPYVHLSRANMRENDTFVTPENTPVGGVSLPSQWNSGLRSLAYSSSGITMELPHYPVTTSGPVCDPFPHPSAPGNICPVPQHFPEQTSSSSSYGYMLNGGESGILDPRMGSGRGHCKRKSPAISDIYGRGGTSGSYGAGNYSNSSVPSDMQTEKATLASRIWPFEPVGMTHSYRGSNLTIAESSERNVRSRSTAELEVNLARTHLSNNQSHHFHPAGSLIDPYGRVHHADLNINATRGSDHNIMPHAAHGRVVGSETNVLSRGPNQFLAGPSNYNPVEFNGYHHQQTSSRYPVVPPQYYHGSTPQVMRGGRRGYESAMPPSRVTPGHTRVGCVAASSENGLRSLPEAYSSRYSRTSTSMGYHSVDRSGRSRAYGERLRSLSDDTYAHERHVSEGIMMVDRSAWYTNDRHRDMRLDIDNMSYEELLALEETIGTVSTGLSEDCISKCLKMTFCCNSSDETQEKGNCVICLEEYKDEEVGTLISCGHDYHVDCIQKWLSMKNTCPICKAPALKGDDAKK